MRDLRLVFDTPVEVVRHLAKDGLGPLDRDLLDVAGKNDPAMEEARIRNIEDPDPEYVDMSRWPTALEKSFDDEFSYALGLRSGLVIYYSMARQTGKDGWIHLEEPRIENGPMLDKERGIDIRESEIVWVKDAPEGS